MLAVAGLSARALAEAAQRSGYEVIALDLFGDADTRRASLQWLPIGDPAHLRIEPARVLSALAMLAERGDVTGWVAGGGFDGHAALLEEGAALLPLIGNAPRAIERVRDPVDFFGVLARRGVAHPELRWTPPDDPAGWLLKDAHGCGGWHIRRWRTGMQVPPHHYFQREEAGTPMSATFIAAGRRAIVLGFNELIVRAIGARPYVYCGVVGPVQLPASAAEGLAAMLQDLVAEFGLCGLGGLDFVWQDGHALVLEINPRPPASLALYDQRLEHGLMHAHCEACLRGEWTGPVMPPLPGVVEGHETVFARRTLHIADAAARHLAGRPDLHDLPSGATTLREGDPVCTVSTQGPDAQQVRARLQAARDGLLDELEGLERT